MHKHKIRNIIGLEDKVQRLIVLEEKVTSLENKVTILLDKFSADEVYQQYITEYPDIIPLYAQYENLEVLCLTTPRIIPVFLDNPHLRNLLLSSSTIRDRILSDPSLLENLQNNVDDEYLAEYIINDHLYTGVPPYNINNEGLSTEYQKLMLDVAPVSDWYNKPASFYSDWEFVRVGQETTATKVALFNKYVVFNAIPHKVRVHADDKISIYINGHLAFEKGGCPNNTFEITEDLSQYITLGEISHVCVMMDNGITEGSNNGYCYWGFIE